MRGTMRAVGVALALVVVAGCASRERRIEAKDIAGTVVLETYTVDLRWGYKLSGLYIDGDGAVWTYEHRGTPWYPERLTTGEVSERDLLTKHKGARQIGTVDVQRLVEMARMIPAAAGGHITRAYEGGDEGSGTRDVAYTHDRERRMYTEVVLAGSGDLLATNASPEARALRNYLREVGAALGVPPPDL